VEPNKYKFGGGAAETLLHPLVFAALVVVIIALLALPRRHAIAAFIFGTFLVPAGQEIFVGGVHLFVYRIIVLVAFLRMMRFKQRPSLVGGWNCIDTAFSLTVVCHVVAFSLLYMEQTAMINQFGVVWDSLGGYIFLRYAIRDKRDIVRAIKCFAVLAFIFAACMIREKVTGENVFGLLGGVTLKSEVREGHVRSQAVFQHAILAGVFGATLVPVFVLLWKNTQSKITAVVGVASATIMVVTTACSTPVLAYAASVTGILLWPFRRGMRWFRWGIVLGLLSLSLLMRGPVWYLVAHMSIFSESSGNHRAELLGTFIEHFGEWWLLGAKSNGDWGYGMFDTSNQYVEQGVTGGLFSLIFFIATIASAFRRVGRKRKSVEGDTRSEWFLWLLGSALFANVVAFFGISYFDQTKVAWFALLAVISAATTRSSPKAAAGGDGAQVLTNNRG
jgi:hypothetical protein